MAGAITVPAGFLDDWNFFCQRAGFDRNEQDRLRHQVRENFASMGAHVIEMAAVYRFCDATWGAGRLPSSDLARGYCASKSWWPADDGLFERLGPLLLAKLCACAAGVIPWPAQ